MGHSAGYFGFCALILLQSCRTTSTASQLNVQLAESKSSFQNGLQPLAVDFAYKPVRTELPSSTSATIELSVRDNRVPADAVADVYLEDLSGEDDMRRSRETIYPKESNSRLITLVGLKPRKVYRAWVNLHTDATELSRSNAVGYVPNAYYFITGGPKYSDIMRHRVVSGALQRYYYAQKGYSEGSNLDCVAFCKHYSEPIFPNWDSRNMRGSAIPNLTAEGSSIIGDYVRIPGHSFLTLVYNRKERVVWTVEGNFNQTIKIAKRYIDNSWQLTHYPEQGWPLGVIFGDAMRVEKVTNSEITDQISVGDRITGANNTAVSSIDEFRRVFDQHLSDESYAGIYLRKTSASGEAQDIWIEKMDLLP